jgi:hypothetical protein
VGRLRSERGQALLLLLGVVAAVLVGALVLVAVGQALGGRSGAQRAADLAAVSAASRMRADYSRLFESPVLEDGAPNPAYLSTASYMERARTAAISGARRNGARIASGDIDFPGDDFAPTRVRVQLRDAVKVRVGGRERRRVGVRAKAVAELAPDAGVPAGMPANGSGGGYDGPLAYRMGKPMRPDVAQAFDRMAAAARRDGIALSITSAFRSDAEQARLFAANPNPKWVAPPGTSLHRYGTELDLGPPGAYGWLLGHAGRFGFIHRYAWEPWHFGFGTNPRDVPAQYEKGAWEPPDGDNGRIKSHLPSFVPVKFHDPIAKAALRWNVPMNLLAAQLYAESGFNPFARSPVGAQGIAQFMPGTAQSYGLSNPFDADASIMAQAHLMHDLLTQFGGKIAFALAAYNAGAGAVQRYGGVPPFGETRAYVAKIMGMLNGTGDLDVAPTLEVKLVE